MQARKKTKSLGLLFTAHGNAAVIAMYPGGKSARGIMADKRKWAHAAHGGSMRHRHAQVYNRQAQTLNGKVYSLKGWFCIKQREKSPL